MVAYVIKFERKGIERTEHVDAKDLKSAKRKIERKLAIIENHFRPKSKQTETVRIKILSYSIVGYY